MRRGVVVAVLILTLLPAVASAGSDGSTVLIDRPSGIGSLPFDGVNQATVGPHALSADGRYVVFSSTNDVLAGGGDRATQDVYRYDRQLGRLDLVDTTPQGARADVGSDSFSPTISWNGRYVAFTTDARNLHPEPTAGNYEILVKDMMTGGIELASREHGPNGRPATRAFQGVLAPNGRAVLFDTDEQFDAGQADGPANSENLYIRYLTGDQTFLVSVKSDGTAGGGVRGGFDLSMVGGDVAFMTDSALTASDTDDDQDAYFVTFIGATTPAVRLASFTVGNTSGAGSAEEVAISTDGSRVAFGNDRVWLAPCNSAGCGAATQADQPTPGATNQEILGLGFPVAIANPNTNTAAPPAHVFWTTDRALLPEDTNGTSDGYARALPPGANTTGLTLLSGAGVPGGTLTGDVKEDLSVVAFASGLSSLPGTDGVRAQAFVRASSQNTLISQPPGQAPRSGEVEDSTVQTLHSVSGDGRVVVFDTLSPGLGAPIVGTFWASQVLARDVVAATTTLASATPAGGPANRHAYDAHVSDAGDRVVFASSATNLLPGVTNGAQHVYLRDLKTGTTRLVDQIAGGAPTAQGAADPRISGDGSRVLFTSRDPGLPNADGNTHVYELDLANGATTLVDRTAAGVVADDGAGTSDLSTDGRRVAFISSSTNLGPGGNGRPRAYVKDLDTGALTWVSVPQDGDPEHVNSFEVAISGHGGRVAFVDNSATFGFGADGAAHVYVRDVADGTPARVPSVDHGAGVEQRSPSMSRDGTRLAFVERVPNTLPRAYVRDLSAGATMPANGGRFGAFDASLSASGTCVALASRSDDLVSPSYGPDFNHVFLRAVGGDCPPISPPISPGGGGAPGGGAGAPGGSTPGGGATGDTKRPVISRLSLTRKRFRVDRKRTARAAATKRGTAFRFTLTENATTTIAISRALPGRRKGSRCVTPSRSRRGKRCTRFVAVKGHALVRAKTRKGTNTVAYTGRVGRTALKPGTYRALLIATDKAGNRSRQRTIAFTIVRR